MSKKGRWVGIAYKEYYIEKYDSHKYASDLRRHFIVNDYYSYRYHTEYWIVKNGFAHIKKYYKF